MGDTTKLDSTPADKHRDLRGSPRFKVEDVVPWVYEKGLLTPLGIGRENHAKETINLSLGGILVRLDQRIKAGTKVGVRLDVEKFNDVIEVDGVVRWCFQAVQDSRNFFAGIQFTQVSRSMKSKIAQLQGYFMSPEFKSKTARRKLKDPLEIGR